MNVPLIGPYDGANVFNCGFALTRVSFQAPSDERSTCRSLLATPRCCRLGARPVDLSVGMRADAHIAGDASIRALARITGDGRLQSQQGSAPSATFLSA